MSDEPASARPDPGGPLAVFEGWFATAGKFAAVTTAILYGVLRQANAFFYAPLGVKPEEVGLGRADILAQSVTGLVIVLAETLVLGVVILGVGYFYGLLFRGPRRGAGGRRGVPERAPGEPPGAAPRGRTSLDRIRSWGWFGSLIGALAAVGLVSPFVPAAVTDPLFTVITMGLVIGAVVSKVRADLMAGRVHRLRRTAAVLFAVATVFVLAIVSLQGWLDGRAVRDGQVRHAVFGGGAELQLSSWGADAATVTWIGGGASPPELAGPTCFLYLGRADGVVVLFDPRTRRSIRVPGGDVVVSVDTTVANGQIACR